MFIICAESGWLNAFVVSWAGLNEEMKLDMQRIWKRNLGRDDRCIADNGKEVPLLYLLQLEATK